MRYWKLSPLVLLFGMVCAAHANSVDTVGVSATPTPELNAVLIHSSGASLIDAGLIYAGMNARAATEACPPGVFCKLDGAQTSTSAFRDLTISPVPEPIPMLTVGVGILAIFLGRISADHSAHCFNS